jgi:hypothetical protein
MSTNDSTTTSTGRDTGSGAIGTEIVPMEAEILEERGIGTARVASLGGATVHAEVYEGMTLLSLLNATGFSLSGTEQVTMNGLVVRNPGSTIVRPNAIIVIAGRVSNGNV